MGSNIFFFTMVNHFTKYGWIIPLKNITAKNVRSAFKKCITASNVQTTQQNDITDIFLAFKL